MKAKNWIMALIVALANTALGVAQTGESTIEGVPVVEDIMTDSTAEETTTQTTPTKVGTWHITTTFANDSLDSTEIIEITEGTFEDMPDFLKELIKFTGLGFATGTIFFVLAVLLCIFGLPILLIVGLLYLIFRKRKEPTSTYQPTEVPATSATDRTLFNKGVKNICLGVGLAIFLGIWMGDFGVGIGVLVICIGIGELLVDYFSKR